MSHADVAAVRALAAEVQGLAAEAQRVAGELRTAQGVEFQSAGAARYRARLEQRSGHVDGTARELEEASRALAHHARQAEARLRELERLEDWFHDRVRDARSALARSGEAADDLADGALREAQAIVGAARRAPAAGSPDWDVFTRGLRR